jgi:lipopolysaccharide/colanic/teichoic acid biosynthesis glycosyltransferase
MLLISIAIRLSSPGPVLEALPAMGWQLRPFTLLRFRCHRLKETAYGELRVATALGTWLQHLHLDGLPLLLNVLRGEMALVGPDPVRIEFAEALFQALPYYRLRYAVKPGLVGWSGINAGPLEDTLTRLEFDLYYIKYVSLSLDLSILRHALLPSRSKARAGAEAAAGD